jgi:hypothetical protein
LFKIDPLKLGVFQSGLGTTVVIDSLLLFACPRNPRPPKTKQPVFGNGFSIKLEYYCGEKHWCLDDLNSLNADLHNKHEKQMLKPQ